MGTQHAALDREDAATGETLLDTLVNPGHVLVEPGAQAVHGITDAELATASSWQEVAPAFLAAIGGRHVLAYNAPFDAGRILTTHSMAGLDVTELPRPGHWWCLMQARSIWARIGCWLPLGGGHRALGDARDAYELLHAIAAPLTRRGTHR
ncbi:3'-5' exonuclease [[Actinomadura] parvosata]|uniref:3'-5' exonuclease n=1 Tax=[Actinomadura] parvosata TaxID=1955412 RepID=UPI00406CB47F